MTDSSTALTARRARVAAELDHAGRGAVVAESPAAIAFLTEVDVRGFSGRGPVAVARRDGSVALVASLADRPLIEGAGYDGEVRYWTLGRTAERTRLREIVAAAAPDAVTPGAPTDTELLDAAMRTRDADEIVRLREAANLADIGYTAIVDRMTRDLRSLEIVRNVDRSLRSAGGGGWWSPLERAEGASVMTHYPVQSIAVLLGRGVEPGVLDVASTLPFALYPLSRGYAGAAGTTIVLSAPSAELRSQAEALGAGVQAALAALAPGVTGGQVHAAFAAALGGTVPLADVDPLLGYSIGTGMGGVLIDAHSRDELQPDEAISIRAALPGVGGSGIAFQTTALITESGAEVLNRVPMRLIELY
ncbi:Xaa-Pro peptidase family protein [Schumannella luteola]|uniref:Xaa-Pro aminopeptidase n=1 Tax=Schumannella luteola TaxID=472059 RepID=A0A852Y429_9MICO|nr:M24 family metallopeptidase [Schumannella luteola]NYG97666.1 Xaa-Pro aminopeptidase [Schumannella luteola]TPX01459.1 M24 family metallopeptidase [Schumannella luteola]